MSILTYKYNFTTALKVFPTKGNLVYEYNPFRNYRLELDMIYYDNRLWTFEEFCVDLYFVDKNLSESVYKALIQANNYNGWNTTKTAPVIYLKGQLVDFETDELNFDLNHPVNITPQWSYDNSVNLIINDGKNPPRLINSRFSPTERNQYLICDRKGNNDTNIYDLGSQFDIDTSLYRKTVTIPKLNFLGVYYGGNLGIGNYHFYFRYVDEDGNESDYFAESGLVSLFIGSTPDSIYSGFRNENSHKMVKFYLSNTDPGYYKVVIYYTVATSDILQNATVTARRIDLEFLLNQSSNTIITITGFENTVEVPLTDINPTYLIYGSVETQDACLNMLFLGNVERPEIPYNDLADCALRFLPFIETETYTSGIDLEYSGNASNNYYDPNFIYNKVGYWDDEIYRFGIVFILSDNTLTPVFNTRGILTLPTKDAISSSYNSFDFLKTDESGEISREYINYNEETFLLENGKSLENCKGVVSFDNSDSSLILGINFLVPSEVIDYLKNTIGIKGYFFVRQKRIPTTLCQAYTIALDTYSHTPVLPVADVISYKINTGTTSDSKYITESFLSLRNYTSSDDDSKGNLSKKIKLLNHEFNEHLIGLNNASIKGYAAICPDYDVNSPYLNSLFTGSKFIIRPTSTTELLTQLTSERHFSPRYDFSTKEDNYYSASIIGVEDNTKLVAIGSTMFSARAGEAEEAFRYEYASLEIKTTEGVNLLRGSYGSYLGITGYDNPGKIIDIKIPGYNKGSISDYFKIRYSDKKAFYAISDRIDLSKLDEWYTQYNDDLILYNTLYRGDCYICQFTHRLNRNFQDPSAPTNTTIVDEKCWRDNFEVEDGIVKKDNFDKINLGDVNAVGLGMWITFTVRSNMNLNIRAIDNSIDDETSLTGHPRGFYPYQPMTINGAYKVPEALCYNKGFEKSVSERLNYEVPDVPWIKNEFSNRIAYSNIQVTDGFRNGFRTFKGTAYRDYPKTYGSITKIIELRGNLVCVFEHGIALIPINERAVAGEGSGGNIYINTSNVLPENPNMISDKFGSQWRESVIKTPRGIYGVDTVGKKIWRTNGQEFELISDFKVQEFLNQNISLTERELTPIIGVRNVKTHYNAFKGDVMFTFYDNLYGFEEKAWNLCFNENLSKWITFYSWIPSYSENIYNQFFSFDRNTSKWIGKLGTSTTDSVFADGVTVKDPIIDFSNKSKISLGKLSLSNRTLPSGTGITSFISYELMHDNYGFWNFFEITDGELYYTTGKSSTNKPNSLNTIFKEFDIPVILLNIRANISVTGDASSASLAEAYTNNISIDAGYYDSVLTLIPRNNLDNLTTDFWKHGQAGIIDIADEIKPTYWYGKQHPFEFEFVVADNPGNHKIFNNLKILSNKAAPESFHYEIVGQCYDFAKDKLNMYIRLEATKELYQYNGTDITYDSDYKALESEHRPLTKGDPDPKYYDKSTIFPLYYHRHDSINAVEDYYKNHTHSDAVSNPDYSDYAGAEIVRYKNLNEYRIWNHAKAVDINDVGPGKGNMYYKEDIWDVVINPINIVYKNETKDDWKTAYALSNSIHKVNGNDKCDLVPAECNLFYAPTNSYDRGFTLPDDWERNIILWKDYLKINKEVNVKDKFVKIRIRYSGEDLAIISAITTLYSISYA